MEGASIFFLHTDTRFLHHSLGSSTDSARWLHLSYFNPPLHACSCPALWNHSSCKAQALFTHHNDTVCQFHSATRRGDGLSGPNAQPPLSRSIFHDSSSVTQNFPRYRCCTCYTPSNFPIALSLR